MILKMIGPLEEEKRDMYKFSEKFILSYKVCIINISLYPNPFCSESIFCDCDQEHYNENYNFKDGELIFIDDF